MIPYLCVWNSAGTACSNNHFNSYADVLKALNNQLDADWREFGTYLYIKPAVMDGINREKSKVSSCMLLLVEKWLCREDGTGDLSRTWKSVVQAVKDTGKRFLAQQLEKRYRVIPFEQ